ncbi:DUF5131 family protein [Streptomyces cellulosae]
MREGSYSAAWISVTTTRPLRRIHCGLRHERPGFLARSAAVGEAAGFQHVCHQMPWELRSMAGVMSTVWPSDGWMPVSSGATGRCANSGPRLRRQMRLGSRGMEGRPVSDRCAIEWTEATWNPTTGCDRVSPGCDNCYALTLAKRLKAVGSPKYQADGDPRTSGPGFGLTVHPDALSVPSGWKSPRTVFVNSMSDLFHARVPLDYVRRVFDVTAEIPQHTNQVLTKRARRLRQVADRLEWPDNLWMGVSVESARELPRVDDLRQVPATVRFLSCEPLLGSLEGLELSRIDWVIAGGESGADGVP